ncbi:SurA N-terminal domain-containing protein [Paracoccus sp. 1_MG-2023]|uniref:SurA N-terminal domain-containing protein n=1 Tax=unclassified Paracoccus (in: a-proteobacteria) TaxID=2688777 RepID=UPI0020910619|nr:MULTISPECIES: SurA N-terminal domain-containing protein [unclassified Paracoccus (in: a-proteobacteria)]MDO6667699.1 SurA N-terminal domain-containing protein [Paracoccus sp. 1_MG-2023]
MPNLRTKGKSSIVWILMGLMVMGLGGFGVTSFSGGSSRLGKVGDTDISAQDYGRALQAQINAISQQTGQRITMAQAREMGVPQSVMQQLVSAAALAEEADRIGVSVGDQQVAQAIRELGAFQGPNGDFDRTAYGQVLQREGYTESTFEEQIREDEARLILQRAVTGGVVAPEAMVDQTARWILQTRDLSWVELSEDDLIEEIATPDEEALRAWHEANADRFTAPEIRKLTYAWVTPDRLAPEVELDEAALRETYEQHIAEYQQPERRIVSRLVFPSVDEAEAAQAQIAAGEADFDSFVTARGLSAEDAELGEVTEADLGANGADVFALADTGVVGPLQTDLGPALFQVNAILDPIDIPFEAAQEDLRTEAAIDRAARQIATRSADYEDLLAGGVPLEEVAEDTEMQLGQIDWSAELRPEGGSIAGYDGFREIAAEVSTSDFPELHELADGGVFALRLDEIVQPTLIPFDEVRDEVAADWRRSELHRQLLARAADLRLQQMSDEVPVVDDQPANDQPADEQPADEQTVASLDWQSETGLSRDAYMDGLPPQLLAQAFDLDEPGETEVVDAGDRVFLVRLDQVTEADLSDDNAAGIRDALSARLNQSLQGDIFDFYARHVQRNLDVTVNQQAVESVNSQVQ